MFLVLTLLQAHNNCPVCVYVSGVVWNGVVVKGVKVMCVAAQHRLFFITCMTHSFPRYQDLMAGGILEFTMTDNSTHGSQDRGCHIGTNTRSILKLPPLHNSRDDDPLCSPLI